VYNRAKYRDDKNWEDIKNPAGSIKYDGAAFFMRIGEDGSPSFISRRQSVKGDFPDRSNKLPHLIRPLPSLAGNVYHVELIHTGFDPSAKESHPKVSGILNSLPPKAIETQKLTGPVRAVLLDVIQPQFGTYNDKLEHLKEVEKSFGNSDLLFAPQVKMNKEEIKELIRNTQREGREGVVVTSRDTPEDKNERIKVKHFNTYNLRVNKIHQEFDIRGNPKQSAGALELVDGSGKVVGEVGTGFLRSTREDIWKNPKNYLGKIIQVKAMDPVARKLRHAVYNGFGDGDVDTL
jgi:hypothetical protein